MMRILSFAAALAILATQLHALSCLRPTVERSFQEARAANETYIVVLGTFDFDPANLPQSHGTQNHKPDNMLSARFDGYSLSKSGFNFPLKIELTLNAQCFGPWCAGAEPGVETLAFVEKADDGYALSISPCGGRTFANPTEDMIESATACMQGKSCKPPQ